jgi:hypothetical protein
MPLFSRWLPAVVLPLLLAGCPDPQSSDDSKTLRQIHYYVNDITTGYEMDVRILPTNEVHVWTRGRSPGDNRPPFFDVLTDAERAELIASFKGWKKLDKFYPTDVSPQYTITYDGYSVTTTKIEGLPATYRDAKGELDRIASSMIRAYDNHKAQVAAQAATQPALASQPATQPASQPAPAVDPPDTLPVLVPVGP